METFALFVNAKMLNKHASAILTVSDSLVTKKAISSEEREKSTHHHKAQYTDRCTYHSGAGGSKICSSAGNARSAHAGERAKRKHSPQFGAGVCKKSGGAADQFLQLL